jgi:hypothetical protein
VSCTEASASPLQHIFKVGPFLDAGDNFTTRLHKVAGPRTPELLFFILFIFLSFSQFLDLIRFSFLSARQLLGIFVADIFSFYSVSIFHDL